MYTHEKYLRFASAQWMSSTNATTQCSLAHTLLITSYQAYLWSITAYTMTYPHVSVLLQQSPFLQIGLLDNYILGLTS